ncbi:MAG: hypothetical protein PHD67_07160, partial [Oscillospiraceae bacterium]|nr:hypothetical protein [Oscillospiraceae bacterium]
ICHECRTLPARSFAPASTTAVPAVWSRYFGIGLKTKSFSRTYIISNLPHFGDSGKMQQKTLQFHARKRRKKRDLFFAAVAGKVYLPFIKRKRSGNLNTGE